MLIKFKLILTIENLLTGTFHDLTKIITKRNINLETGIASEISKSDITIYFEKNIKQFCKENNIEVNDIAVDGYEIESLTKNIHIYFKAEDLRCFSLAPSIMAYSKNVETVIALNCEQIDNNAIRWYWNCVEDDGHFLINEKNKVVANIPVGISSYIESGLESNKTYTRKLATYDGKNFNSLSQECSMTIIEDKTPSLYTKFKVEDRIEDIQSVNTILSDRLEAFKSGVGDNLDCKLFKTDDLSYSKRFKLLNKIYGVRASNDIKYNTVQFKYRYKLTGTTDYVEYNDAKVKVALKATPIVSISSVPDDTPVGEPLYAEAIMEYKFGEYAYIADVHFKDLIPELIESYSARYLFEITILEAEGNFTIYSYANGYTEEKNLIGGSIEFSEKGHFAHKISIVAKPTIKQKEYIEFYPPRKYDALVGAVNGDFQSTPNGKKDMNVMAHKFETPSSIYNLKYYCVIEEVNPSETYVKYKFKNEVKDTGYTLVNGDNITFSSDAITEDNEEYKDLLAQIEQGEFIINDSIKHTYRYTINDIVVNTKKYKRFELDIVPTINDIKIITYDKILNINELNKVDTDVKVELRAVQNALAKWEPLIHNGYYYLNQNEYYMYTNCVMNGEGREIDEVYSKPSISIKAKIEAKEPSGPIEYYDIVKNTKDSLLLDENLFFWYDNKIWPKPINVVEDFNYDFLDEYDYYSEPFVFNKIPTELTSITWEQICKPPNTLRMYVESYNEVYGTWDYPVEIFQGEPLQEGIRLSKAIRLKANMNPTKIAELETREFTYSCEYDWTKNIDNFFSINAYYKEETLKSKSPLSECIYISKAYDLGDTDSLIKERSILPEISFIGDEVKVYIQQARDKDDILESCISSSWVEVENNIKIENVKRYYRFKIVVSPNSFVKNFKLTVQRYECAGMAMEDFMPAIGNLRVKAKYDPSLITKTYEYAYTTLLEFDKNVHVIVESLEEMIKKMSSGQGFLIENILNYNIEPYGGLKDKFEITYNQDNITDEPIYGQSFDIVFDDEAIENHQKGVIFDVKDNKIKLSPIPQQYSPVIIHRMNNGIEDKNPMTNVFFSNDNGEFTLENKEVFESLGFKTLYLKYQDIDKYSLTVEIDGNSTSEYKITNNIIEFDNVIQEGSIITVKYKLKNSFCMNYDYYKDEANIEVHLFDRVIIDKVKVFYETNKTSSIKKLNGVCLNPIYSTAYNGYIYITDEYFEPSSVKIYPATNYVYANGSDEINVIIKVTDINNNPVENVQVDVTCIDGNIIKVFEKTDFNGVILCRYTSANVDCEDIITATISELVTDTETITNKKL